MRVGRSVVAVDAPYASSKARWSVFERFALVFTYDKLFCHL